MLPSGVFSFCSTQFRHSVISLDARGYTTDALFENVLPVGVSQEQHEVMLHQRI
jgi:hypothetical protein